MSINEQVYGAKSTWLDTQYQYTTITPKAKKANFGGEGALLMTGVAKGKLSYTEPIDKSIGYCGLGTESALSHLTYIGMKNGEPSIISTQDRFVTNFCWCEKTLNNPPTVFGSYYQYDNITLHSWGDYATTFNYNKVVEPLTVVCPQNQILLIWLQAYNADFSLSWEGGLKDYESTYHTTYPNITCVYLRTFFGNKAQNISMIEYTAQGLKIPWQLSILDNYVCEDFNLDFYDYAEPLNVVFGVFNNTNLMYKYSYFAIVATTENAIEHIKVVDLNTTNYRVYIEYYEDFAEDVRKTVACFGLYFTDDLATAQNGTLTLSDMYIGLLDDDGIGHGEYLKGTETANAPQNDWDDMTVSGYDYTKEVDKTKYKNDTEFYDSGLANGFTRFWVLDSSGVDALLSELYNIMAQDDPDESIERYNMKVFLTQNPIDAVISLKKFPIDNVPAGVGPYRVQIGSKNTNISAFPLAASCGIYTFSFSSSDNTNLYPHYHKDFRDYEPYTKAELYVPFCGTYEIPCTYLYDYGGLVLKLVIDFVSGACTGYILVHGICIGSVSGNCAISLPLSGIQNATLDSQIHSAAIRDTQRVNSLAAGIAAGAVSIAAGLLTGGAAALAGVAGAALSIGTAAVKSSTEQAAINYEISHMQTPLKMVSTASGQIAHTYDMRAKLTVTRPKISNDYDATIYGDTIGFACLIDGIVSDFHGFTSGVINVDGINATAEEKEMIRSAFASGVYLPNNE